MAVGTTPYSTDIADLAPVPGASIWAHIASWVATCSDYFAAASIYDELRAYRMRNCTDAACREIRLPETSAQPVIGNSAEPPTSGT
jgi:hypothetical protein